MRGSWEVKKSEILLPRRVFRSQLEAALKWPLQVALNELNMALYHILCMYLSLNFVLILIFSFFMTFNKLVTDFIKFQLNKCKFFFHKCFIIL